MGTLAVCFVLSGAGAEVASVFAITKAAALAYLVFNLFTPPCIAAIAAMSAEMKSKKWLFGAIAFQLGVGFSVSFSVYQIGTLITTGGFGVGFIPGLIAILVFAAIIIGLIHKTNKELKAEYTLISKKAA